MAESAPYAQLLHGAEPIFAFCLDLEQEAAERSAEDLKARCQAMLDSFEAEGRRAGAALTQIEHAKYALVALIDERIFLSDLPAKDAWMGEPLQLRLFGDFDAGEQFYQRCDQLLHGSAPRPALEVFHACLGLGFRGKYADRAGEERRKVLMEQIASEILREHQGHDSLGPNALSQRSDDAASTQIPVWRAWLPSIVVGAALVLTIIICEWWLGSAIADIRAVFAL